MLVALAVCLSYCVVHPTERSARQYLIDLRARWNNTVVSKNPVGPAEGRLLEGNPKGPVQCADDMMGKLPDALYGTDTNRALDFNAAKRKIICGNSAA